MLRPLREVMAPFSLLGHKANNLALGSLSACYKGFRVSALRTDSSQHSGPFAGVFQRKRLSPPLRACCRHELNLFRLVEFRSSRSSPSSTSITSITNVNCLKTVSGTGFCLFRTGFLHTERMQDIRGVSGISI